MFWRIRDAAMCHALGGNQQPSAHSLASNQANQAALLSARDRVEYEVSGLTFPALLGLLGLAGRSWCSGSPESRLVL
jgi:hypothetical protein